MDCFEQYGFTRRQLSAFLLGCEPEKVRSKVVFAPCWHPESVGIRDLTPVCSNGIWDCGLGAERFTYIVAGVGAGICSDKVLSLRETSCQRILFLGSAGSICQEAKIGDLAIPDEVVCADGLCRYLFAELNQDCYGRIYRPGAALQKHIYNQALAESEKCPDLGISCRNGKSASVETIYSQFRHIDAFRKMQVDYLEMECAAFLCSAEIANIDAAAVFCISDNAVCGQSLITVSRKYTQFRKEVRGRVMLGILAAFLEKD